jgi:hypothetical protein
MSWLLRLLTLLILCCSASAQTGSDLVKLSSGAYTALQDLNSAFDEVLQVQDALIAFDHGKVPKSPDNHWSDLATRYRAAIREIKAAPLPSTFDPTPYAFSPDRLANCATRDDSLRKAQGYLAELRKAQQRVADDVAQMDAAIARASKASQALNYLVDNHLRLAALPNYGAIFAVDFLVLETEVKPALGDVDSALKENKRKLTTEGQKLSTSAQNLQSNLAILEQLKCSSLAGHWVGTHRQTLTCSGKICITEESINADLTQTASGLTGNMTSSQGRVVSGACTAHGDRSSHVDFSVQGNSVSWGGYTGAVNGSAMTISRHATGKCSSDSVLTLRKQ